MPEPKIPSMLVEKLAGVKTLKRGRDILEAYDETDVGGGRTRRLLIFRCFSFIVVDGRSEFPSWSYSRRIKNNSYFPELNDMHDWDAVNPTAAEVIKGVLKKGRRDRLFGATTLEGANIVIKEMKDAGESIDGGKMFLGAEAGEKVAGELTSM